MRDRCSIRKLAGYIETFEKSPAGKSSSETIKSSFYAGVLVVVLTIMLFGMGRIVEGSGLYLKHLQRSEALYDVAFRCGTYTFLGLSAATFRRVSCLPLGVEQQVRILTLLGFAASSIAGNRVVGLFAEFLIAAMVAALLTTMSKRLPKTDTTIHFLLGLIFGSITSYLIRGPLCDPKDKGQGVTAALIVSPSTLLIWSAWFSAATAFYFLVRLDKLYGGEPGSQLLLNRQVGVLSSAISPTKYAQIIRYTAMLSLFFFVALTELSQQGRITQSYGEGLLLPTIVSSVWGAGRLWRSVIAAIAYCLYMDWAQFASPASSGQDTSYLPVIIALLVTMISAGLTGNRLRGRLRP